MSDTFAPRTIVDYYCYWFRTRDCFN